MTAAPSAAEPTKPPEQTGGGGVPDGIAGLLCLLRWIIGYGRNLAETLHQRTGADFHAFALRYRRPDFNEILARIRRGLMIAAALEGKLLKRAATGRDVAPVENRYPQPRTGRSGTDRKQARRRHVNFVDMPPDRLPTAEEIAAELRRRPIGAVLVDICRDLGIGPGDLTKQQWDDLQRAIIEYGGYVTVLFFKESELRLQPLLAALRGETSVPAATGSPGNAAARPTGPPDLAMAA